MAKIKLKIVVPEKVVYEKEVDQVTLPTEQGEITILPNHIPLVSIIKAGEIMTKTNGEADSLAVSGGFLEVKKNEVVVLTETAELAEEIDQAQAEEAKTRAQKLLAEAKNREDVDYTALASKIEKELARLKVARKRKHYSQPNINSPR